MSGSVDSEIRVPNKDIMKDIEKILAPFDLSLGRKQDFGTLLIHLKNNNVSIEEVIQYISDLRKDRKKARVKKPLIFCPICNKPMELFSVNDKPETQTGDPKDKSVWVCQNSECKETVFNEQTVQEIINDSKR